MDTAASRGTNWQSQEYDVFEDGDEAVSSPGDVSKEPKTTIPGQEHESGPCTSIQPYHVRASSRTERVMPPH